MEIKKELVINASVSRVYDAITDITQLSQWFPDVVSLEPKIDGKIIFRFPGPLSDVSDTIEGKILELEKNKKLVYSWSHPNVPDFPLTKVSWILEYIEENRTKVVIVHSGFVDENVMNSYNTRWGGIAERLDIFAVSKKPEKTRKQITFALILIPICLAFLAIITAFKNSDEFVTGFFWISLLIVTSLVLIPFVEKYKKFSWGDHPIIASIGITCIAQVIATVYWGLAFDAATMPPLMERLAIDVTSFYFLMISLIPIGCGVSYMAIKFSNNSKIIQSSGLFTIQFSEIKINVLLATLVAFQVLLNIVTYSVVT